MKKQGGFPVSLASDHAGNIWVGTEGNGVWKYNPGKKEWTQFTTKEGLGDDCVYALAVDNLNRVWAGHLNHGVSVFNGEKWSNYGLIDGPLGDRVFAMAVSPKDDDVWMATDMGLARYSEKRQDWDYYTRASGLPSDQIQKIAFELNGQIYVGTQCGEIATASADDDYGKWRTVSQPKIPWPDNISVRHRANGFIFYATKGMKVPHVMVRASLTLPGQPPLFAAYDRDAGCLLTDEKAAPLKATASGTNASTPAPNLPVPGAAPNA